MVIQVDVGVCTVKWVFLFGILPVILSCSFQVHVQVQRERNFSTCAIRKNGFVFQNPEKE